MQKLILAAVSLLAVPMLGLAQSADKQSQIEGYVFIAPIVSNTRFIFNPAYYGTVFTSGQLPADYIFHERGGVNLGFGGEANVYKGMGVGVELGYANTAWSLDRYTAVGLGSTDLSYHFRPKKNHKRVDPFVTGGYSLYFGHGETSGFNLGGGVNLWAAKHAALRLEGRYYDHIGYLFHNVNRFVALRVGMTFR
jgi:opacity protein-like surface antigen